MGITSFYKIGGENNAPGYYDFAFIPHDQILYLPDPINGIINLNNMVLVDGAQFLSGYATINTLNLGDELKQTEHGGICPVDLSGSTPLVNNLNLHLFTQMAAQRFVILARDNNGRWYIGGEPNNGLVFTFKRKASALDFSLTGQYGHICWEVQGNILLDGSIVDTGKIVDCNCHETPGGGGGGEAGGIVYVKRSDGTLISPVTAPADYNVNDSTAKLKDTSGAEISSTPIKAASGVNDITAPDATINLKDSAGALLDTVTAKSNENKDVVAPNATINLLNTNTDNIGTSSVKSGETKNVAVPDTRVLTKNTLAEIIDDTYVASGVNVEINIGDSAVNIKDSAGALIETKTAPAEKVVETTIPDSSVEITNTLDEVIATVNVKANGSTTQQIDDSNLTLNGAAWADVPAKSAKDFALVDENGTSITPLVADATQIKVNTNASLMGYIYGNL